MTSLTVLGCGDPGAPDAAESSAPAEPPSFEAAVDLQGQFALIAEKTLPSVAGITTYRRIPRSERRGRPGWRASSTDSIPGFDRIGRGSAFVVSADGFLLTAYSLLLERKTRHLANRIEIEVGNEILEARLVGAEPAINLAVLKVERAEPFEPISIDDSDSAVLGHWTIAVGDPPGPGTVFAVGNLSALPDRECYQAEYTATLIQSSAHMPGGGVGGPLLNIRGQVIGINLPLPLGARNEFALPIGLAMTLYEPLIARESKLSPWLGFSVRRLEDTPYDPGDGTVGIAIDDVFDPSPASRADIQVGDILVAATDQPIASVRDFQRWLYLTGIGATVDIQISRDGALSSRTLTIEERPASATMR